MAANKLEDDTLCWRCKCATNPEGTCCPWATQGEPVPGWKADEGHKFLIGNENHEATEEQSYIVRECPLFIKDYEISTIQEAVDEMAKTLNLSKATIKQHFRKKIIQWESVTGRKMPLWIKNKNLEGIEEE